MRKWRWNNHDNKNYKTFDNSNNRNNIYCNDEGIDENDDGTNNIYNDCDNGGEDAWDNKNNSGYDGEHGNKNGKNATMV